MKNFGFRKLIIFIILSATVALAYQLPYLRFTFYDQMMSALQLNNTQMGVLATAIGSQVQSVTQLAVLLQTVFP